MTDSTSPTTDSLAQGRRQRSRYYRELLVGLAGVGLLTAGLVALAGRLLSRWIAPDVLFPVVAAVAIAGIVLVAVAAVHRNLRCPQCRLLMISLAYARARPSPCPGCNALLP